MLLAIIIKKRQLDLEVLCVIDRIPPSVAGKKSVRKLSTEWKDVALRNHALGIPDATEPGDTEIRLLISQEFRSQLSFMSPYPQWSYYRSREGGKFLGFFE